MMRFSCFCLVLVTFRAAAFAPSHQPSRSSFSTRLHVDFLEQLTGIKPAAPKVTVPDDFVIPEPKPLSIAEGTDMGKMLASSAALAVRLGTGAFVLGWEVTDLNYQGKAYSLQLGPISFRDGSSILQEAPRPAKPLILYAYDASPYCKLVRETLNLLDLTFEYRPCPGARQGKFSREMLEKTGRQTVPFLIDPNTRTELFESTDIINYLVETYGPPADSFDRKALWPITNKDFAVGTATRAAILLDMPGARRQGNARPDNENMKPIQVWAYECSPFCRPVFEKLCSLCLPHTVISCARGSSNRDKLFAKTGRFQVPYLVDPNTGVEMFESTAIVDYLEKVYTV
jgi:glutathione S-transferase